MAELLGVSRQTISKHLRFLYDAGMVSRQRVSVPYVYSLCDWTGWWVVEQIGVSVTTRLDEIRAAFASGEEAAAARG